MSLKSSGGNITITRAIRQPHRRRLKMKDINRELTEALEKIAQIITMGSCSRCRQVNEIAKAVLGREGVIVIIAGNSQQAHDWIKRNIRIISDPHQLEGLKIDKAVLVGTYRQRSGRHIIADILRWHNVPIEEDGG
jgi:hypothetical protein